MTKHEETANRLLPCPFCGSEAEIIYCGEAINAGGYCVECKFCKCSSRVVFPDKVNPGDVLIDIWNHRPAVAVGDHEQTARRCRGQGR